MSSCPDAEAAVITAPSDIRSDSSRPRLVIGMPTTDRKKISRSSSSEPTIVNGVALMITGASVSTPRSPRAPEMCPARKPPIECPITCTRDGDRSATRGATVWASSLKAVSCGSDRYQAGSVSSTPTTWPAIRNFVASASRYPELPSAPGASTRSSVPSPSAWGSSLTPCSTSTGSVTAGLAGESMPVPESCRKESRPAGRGSSIRARRITSKLNLAACGSCFRTAVTSCAITIESAPCANRLSPAASSGRCSTTRQISRQSESSSAMTATSGAVPLASSTNPARSTLPFGVRGNSDRTATVAGIHPGGSCSARTCRTCFTSSSVSKVSKTATCPVLPPPSGMTTHAPALANALSSPPRTTTQALLARWFSSAATTSGGMPAPTITMFDESCAAISAPGAQPWLISRMSPTT